MPIYEFFCPKNQRIYSFFARSLAYADKTPRCPENPKWKLEKMVSSFAVTGRAKEKPDTPAGAEGPDFDDPKMEKMMAEMEREFSGMGDTDDPDPKMLGRMMRKMMDLGGDKVPAAMQEMVARPDRFGSNMAYQVGRYHNARGTEATLRLINKIVSDDLSTRQVSDIVKGRVAAQETPKPAGRQRYAQRLEIKLGGKSVGDLKSYGEDRIELRLRGLPKDKRDAILEQLERMLLSE